MVFWSVLSILNMLSLTLLSHQCYWHGKSLIDQKTNLKQENYFRFLSKERDIHKYIEMIFVTLAVLSSPKALSTDLYYRKIDCVLFRRFILYHFHSLNCTLFDFSTAFEHWKFIVLLVLLVSNLKKLIRSFKAIAN